MNGLLWTVSVVVIVLVLGYYLDNLIALTSGFGFKWANGESGYGRWIVINGIVNIVVVVVNIVGIVVNIVVVNIVVIVGIVVVNIVVLVIVIPTIYLFEYPRMKLFLKLAIRCNRIAIIIKVDNVIFIHYIMVFLLLFVIKFIIIFIHLESKLELIVVVFI